MQDGFFGTSVRTLTVDAVFVTSTKWIDDNSDAYDVVLHAISASHNAIMEKVGAQ